MVYAKFGGQTECIMGNSKIENRDPRRELFNTLKKETNLFFDSMTPSSAFATLISMKQGEKTQKIVAKYVYDRFRERDRRVKYNLV